jgi:hypothetical protein
LPPLNGLFCQVSLRSVIEKLKCCLIAANLAALFLAGKILLADGLDMREVHHFQGFFYMLWANQNHGKSPSIIKNQRCKREGVSTPLEGNDIT